MEARILSSGRSPAQRATGRKMRQGSATCGHHPTYRSRTIVPLPCVAEPSLPAPQLPIELRTRPEPLDLLIHLDQSHLQLIEPKLARSARPPLAKDRDQLLEHGGEEHARDTTPVTRKSTDRPRNPNQINSPSALKSMSPSTLWWPPTFLLLGYYGQVSVPDSIGHL